MNPFQLSAFGRYFAPPIPMETLFLNLWAHQTKPKETFLSLRSLNLANFVSVKLEQCAQKCFFILFLENFKEKV